MANSHASNLKKNTHQFAFILIVATYSIGASDNASANTLNLPALFSGTGEMEYAGGFLCDGATNYSPTSSTGSIMVGAESVGCTSDNRGAIEFDISSFADSSTIGSATLSLTTELVYSNDTVTSDSLEIGVHGYAGNGSLDKPDFNIDNQITSFTASASTTYNIDVTGYVRSLVDGSESYAGFMLDCLPLGTFCLSSNSKHIFISGIDSLSNPTLSIEAVPVPAAVWLFGSGLVGLIGVARRKKS